MADLGIGTRLRLIEPEEPVTSGIDSHKRIDAWTPPAETCAQCAHCVGLPEGSEYPWEHIAVIAWDAGVRELIVQPVVFSNVSAPRRVQVDDLLDLYDITEEGQAESGWSTPTKELVR